MRRFTLKNDLGWGDFPWLLIFCAMAFVTFDTVAHAQATRPAVYASWFFTDQDNPKLIAAMGQMTGQVKTYGHGFWRSDGTVDTDKVAADAVTIYRAGQAMCIDIEPTADEIRTGSMQRLARDIDAVERTARKVCPALSIGIFGQPVSYARLPQEMLQRFDFYAPAAYLGPPADVRADYTVSSGWMSRIRANLFQASLPKGPGRVLVYFNPMVRFDREGEKEKPVYLNPKTMQSALLFLRERVEVGECAGIVLWGPGWYFTAPDDYRGPMALKWDDSATWWRMVRTTLLK